MNSFAKYNDAIKWFNVHYMYSNCGSSEYKSKLLYIIIDI